MTISLALAIIVAIGLLLLGVKLWRGEKKWGGILLVGLSPALLVLAAYLGESIQYEIDKANGWRTEIRAEENGFVVSLVQTTGVDFYMTKIEVVRPDGLTADCVLDVDDYRWLSGSTKVVEGIYYFVEGRGEINRRSPFWNPKKGTIGGYTKEEIAVEDLEFS